MLSAASEIEPAAFSTCTEAVFLSSLDLVGLPSCYLCCCKFLEISLAGWTLRQQMRSDQQFSMVALKRISSCLFDGKVPLSRYARSDGTYLLYIGK